VAEQGSMFGKNLLWWVGTVEDRGTGQFSGKKDELKLGRLKVRIHGHHTEDKSVLPTKDLPWCDVATPMTSASISGVGHSPTGITEGSKVYGFFWDSEGGQYPVAVGSFPHVQQKGGSGKQSPGSGPKK
jgi:hypothetical protein